MPVPVRCLAALSLATLSGIALTGCGSASVRYAPPTNENYQQLPLLRPKEAKTFSVINKGKDIPTDNLKIEGMQRVPDNGEVVVVLDYQGVTMKAGNVQSGYVCVANAYTAPDGSKPDLTMSNYYQPMGFRESIIHGTLHLIVSRWLSGTITHSGSFQVTKTDGSALSSGDLSVSQTLNFGKPLQLSYPFQEMMMIAYAQGAVGQDARLQGPPDAAVNKADSYLKGAFADYEYVAANKFIPRSAVENAMKQLAANPESAAKKELDGAWEQEVAKHVNNYGPAMQVVQSHLTLNYASGPRTLPVVFAGVEENPAVIRAGELLAALVALPADQRTAPAAEILRKLDEGKAVLQPDDIRARAAIIYDQALVQYLCGNFAETKKTLLLATAENAKESDGMFSSSGTDLTKKIDFLMRSSEDRAKRLAANS